MKVLYCFLEYSNPGDTISDRLFSFFPMTGITVTASGSPSGDNFGPLSRAQVSAVNQACSELEKAFDRGDVSAQGRYAGQIVGITYQRSGVPAEICGRLITLLEKPSDISQSDARYSMYCVLFGHFLEESRVQQLAVRGLAPQGLGTDVGIILHALTHVSREGFASVPAVCKAVCDRALVTQKFDLPILSLLSLVSLESLDLGSVTSLSMLLERRLRHCSIEEQFGISNALPVLRSAQLNLHLRQGNQSEAIRIALMGNLPLVPPESQVFVSLHENRDSPPWLTTPLTIDEVQTLSTKVFPSSEPPSELIARKFELGVDFIVCAAMVEPRSLSLVANMIEQICKQQAITHIAIPYPTDKERELAQIIQFGSKTLTHDFLYNESERNSPLIEPDPHTEDETSHRNDMLSFLQRIGQQASIIGISEPTTSNRIFNDFYADRFVARLLEKLPSNIDRARVLILSREFPFCGRFEPACDSLSVLLARRIGASRVASVLLCDSEQLNDWMSQRINSLTEPMLRMPIQKSVAVNTGDVPALDRCRFDREVQQTIGESFDIFCYLAPWDGAGSGADAALPPARGKYVPIFS